MAVTIWYFARIKEAVDCEKESLQLQDDVDTVSDLIDLLSERGERWRKALKDDKVLVAINQAVASMHTGLSDEDEIAFSRLSPAADSE